uniref:Uncharacterized protein n=1 Tax=Panagrolaimus sp. ES5 TaxID=591445 RepID=A0AC34FKW5_9BILA
MVKSCKYFFVRNPIIIMSRSLFEYTNNGWNVWFNGEKKVDLSNFYSKIWITRSLCVAADCNESFDPNFLSLNVPKIFQSDIKILNLWKQNISFKDLIFLASKCEKIDLNYGVTVLYEDESIVPLEKIVQVLPKLTDIVYTFWDRQSFTTKTVKELIKLPKFTNLTRFTVLNIPDTFDIDIIYDYIKKNKKAKIQLGFSDQISEEYKNRLKIIKNEIAQTEKENCDFIKPCIHFRLE